MRQAGVPAPRVRVRDMINDEFSTFKRHSAWFAQRASQTLHETHAGELEDFWKLRAQAWLDPKLKKWECMGPFNIAGRVTALVAHATDPRRLLAGAAAGGVWSSADGGASWESCWPKWASPNIGALAFDPADPNRIYCATGEANISPDCYPGSALYISKDGDTNWELLAAADTQNLPRRIGVLLPCKHRPSMLYLGGVTLDESHPAGLYVSADGGQTWRRENGPSRSNYWCHSLVEHPQGFLLAGLELGGAQTGIWRSGGDGIWKQVHAGLPAGDKTGRISLAIAGSRPPTNFPPVAPPRGRDGGTRDCRPATRRAASAWRSLARAQTRFTRWWPTGWAARCWAFIAAATAASTGRRGAGPILPPKARAVTTTPSRCIRTIR